MRRYVIQVPRPGLPGAAARHTDPDYEPLKGSNGIHRVEFVNGNGLVRYSKLTCGICKGCEARETGGRCSNTPSVGLVKEFTFEAKKPPSASTWNPDARIGACAHLKPGDRVAWLNNFCSRGYSVGKVTTAATSKKGQIFGPELKKQTKSKNSGDPEATNYKQIPGGIVVTVQGFRPINGENSEGIWVSTTKEWDIRAVHVLHTGFRAAQDKNRKPEPEVGDTDPPGVYKVTPVDQKLILSRLGHLSAKKANPRQTVSVTCTIPDHIVPGQVFHIEYKGSKLPVVCPEDKKPGDNHTFLVLPPPTSGQTAAPKRKKQAEASSSASKSGSGSGGKKKKRRPKNAKQK